jgi:hypothetical protein
MGDTQYGDEDPEFTEQDDLEAEEELFATARFLGWKPEEMRDRQFAARFAKWLKTAPREK